MKNAIFGIIVGLIFGSAIAAVAASKYESSSADAKSVVLYGQGPSGIVAIEVDANGVIQTH